MEESQGTRLCPGPQGPSTPCHLPIADWGGSQKLKGAWPQANEWKWGQTTAPPASARLGAPGASPLLGRFVV